MTKTAPAPAPTVPHVDVSHDGYVILDAFAAKWLAQAALSAVAKDDTTPMITCAHVRIDDGWLRTVSTDRYRVHTAIAEVKEASDGFQALLPARVLRWIAANASYYGPAGRLVSEPVIRIDWTPNDPGDRFSLPKITVRVSDAGDESLRSPAYLEFHDVGFKGNYPPVERLLSQARVAAEAPAAARLNPELLAAVRQLSRERNYAPAFKFTADTNPNKPGPLLVTFGDRDNPYAEALIQPNLNLR